VNGAHSLLATLVDAGVDVCFANPGTSEMHFVAALDGVPALRPVLTLFEGVATGAADGYARMADKPAATLLHLGPGLGNGLANLHNARKGHTGIVNIVGDHATYHKKYDAQLESDIETVARNVSTWIRRSETPAAVGADAAEAVDRRVDDGCAIFLRIRPLGDDVDLAAERLAFGRDFLQAGRVVGADHHVGAGAGHHLRRQRTERPGRAGDDGGLAFDAEQ